MISLVNKVLVHLIVPELDSSFDIFIPVSRKIGNLVLLLNKTINEMSGGLFPLSDNNVLYNGDGTKVYSADELIAKTDIRNGTTLILIS